MELPQLPTPCERYLVETAKCKTQADIMETTKPFIDFENKLREVFAQYPDHSAAKQDHLVPLYNTGNPTPSVRARDPSKEAEDVRERYLLSLPAEERLKDGAPAIVDNLAQFKTNFK